MLSGNTLITCLKLSLFLDYFSSIFVIALYWQKFKISVALLWILLVNYIVLLFKIFV